VYQHKLQLLASTAHGHSAHVTWGRLLLVWACMIIVPLFVYWCWISVEYHKGNMYLPATWDVEGINQWARDIGNVIMGKAVPSLEAWTIYAIWIILQAALFYWAPGPEGFGVLLEDGKTKLKYRYNGQFAFFFTLILVMILEYTGLFHLR